MYSIVNIIKIQFNGLPAELPNIFSVFLFFIFKISKLIGTRRQNFGNSSIFFTFLFKIFA